MRRVLPLVLELLECFKLNCVQVESRRLEIGALIDSARQRAEGEANLAKGRNRGARSPMPTDWQETISRAQCFERVALGESQGPTNDRVRCGLA